MDKNRWVEFLALRLRSQISLENAQKAQTWGFAIISLLSLGAVLTGSGESSGSYGVRDTHSVFLILFHLVMILGVYLPVLFLEKGRNPLARVLGMREASSLCFLSILITFYALMIANVSFQAIAVTGESSSESPAFSHLVLWINFLVAAIYGTSSLFAFASFLGFPQAIARFVEKGRTVFKVLFGFHIGLCLLLALAGPVEFGNAAFLQELKSAGLFWIFILSSLFFAGRIFSESAVPALAGLELDVTAGRLERQEDILARLKEAFSSRRFLGWHLGISKLIAEKSHQIAQFAHEAVQLISHEKPSEFDLGKVEDRYRRAEALAKKLEKDGQRFALSVFLFCLNEAEREKAEELRDQFSREIRNAKLELAGIRKRIDEKLLQLKSQQGLPSLGPSLSLPKPEAASLTSSKN
ncbi:MAG: CRISPR-associated endonuclease Cas2 [Candidatus Omnitrophica bacterium]|nr:CRISPR-associated endonuclease Cas2 [Candidatus Omnitrophota bacterium]